MSTQKNGPEVTLKLGATLTLLYAVLKLDSSGEAIVTTGADGADIAIATAQETGADLDMINCRLLGGGTFKCVAAKAIAAGDTVYTAAAGKVTDAATSGTVVGICNVAGAADGDIIEVVPAIVSPELGSLPLTGGTLTGDLTFADAVDIILNGTTGTVLATATTQKLGLWGATPVIQPAGAGQADQGALTAAALTDNGGGAAADGTIADIASADAAETTDRSVIADAVKELSDQINKNTVDNAAQDVLLTAIRTALVAGGFIKGAA